MSQFCADVSARGRRWELRPGAAPSTGDVVLRDGYKVPPQVLEVVARRGIEGVADWFEPSLKAFMPDPSTLTAMDDAVARLCRAVEGGERIAVFGDYDVDGATSTAIAIRWLRMVGVADAIFYIPQRLEEGYGPNDKAMDKLRAEGVGLVLCLDSGTGAIDPDPAKGYDPIGHARRIGLDVVVLDHHEPREDGLMPDAIIVNPKRPEDDGSLAYLCTAGLAFLFLVGANRALRRSGFFAGRGIAEPDLRPLLGLAALGTVADMVPLQGLNRAYVKLGLALMPENPGLAALAEATGEVEFSARTCGFVFGPCINAGGRISDTRQGALLLTTDDPEEARDVAARLFAVNRERQDMQRAMVAACVERAAAENAGDAAIVLYDEEWHPGVVGLASNKVKDAFDRTAVVIGQGGKGSGRSVEGFNIGQAFHHAIDLGLIKKGGGHAAAGGLTIDPAKVDEFRRFLCEASKGIERPASKVDLVLPVDGADIEAIEGFEAMAPFGMGNPRPRVAVVGAVLERPVLRSKGAIAAKLFDENRNCVDLILFGGEGTALGDALMAADGRRVDVMGEISINYYAGRRTVQLKVEDAMIGGKAAGAAA